MSASKPASSWYSCISSLRLRGRHRSAASSSQTSLVRRLFSPTTGPANESTRSLRSSLYCFTADSSPKAMERNFAKASTFSFTKALVISGAGMGSWANNEALEASAKTVASSRARWHSEAETDAHAVVTEGTLPALNASTNSSMSRTSPLPVTFCPLTALGSASRKTFRRSCTSCPRNSGLSLESGKDLRFWRSSSSITGCTMVTQSRRWNRSTSRCRASLLSSRLQAAEDRSDRAVSRYSVAVMGRPLWSSRDNTKSRSTHMKWGASHPGLLFATWVAMDVTTDSV
mmetsp:Transcript_41286/g.108380  ORF Transcript_41286/g.108380 Transcript_41286/m.108380 type:complete len:287 (-) Transcript_41286:506-1366(-)